MRRRGPRAIPEWWARLCDGYLNWIVRLGRRPNTRRAYRAELIDFGEWLLAHDVVDLALLTREHIEAWQDDLHGRAAVRTQQVAATAVRGLLRWAADQELGLSNFWLRVVHPRAPRLQPRPIPSSDLLLIEQALDSAEPANLDRLRARALFWVIFSSGARISEALSLRRDSIRDRTAPVIQKGGSPHTLVFSSRAVRAVDDYLSRRMDDDPALFVAEGRSLRAVEAQEAWDALCVQLRIQRFTSHQIRHTCATVMLRNGVDWLVIAKHLGHRSVVTIAGYAAVALESRFDAVAGLDRLLAS